jgi:hypothetical protein
MFMKWEDVTHVGAVHEIDAIVIDDLFFWAIIGDPRQPHYWVPMAGESSGRLAATSEFQEQLVKRGFVSLPLPPKEQWQSTNQRLDRVFLSCCLFPAARKGEILYTVRKRSWLPFSRGELRFAVSEAFSAGE